MRLLAAAFALALAPVAALADVIPPPQPMTKAQSFLVGIWRLTGPGPAAGHETYEQTLVFDKDRYVAVVLASVVPAGQHDLVSQTGTWSARELGRERFELTTTPEGGKPETRVVTMSGADTMETGFFVLPPVPTRYERVPPPR